MVLGVLVLGRVRYPRPRRMPRSGERTVRSSSAAPTRHDVWSVTPDGSGLTNLTDLPGGPANGNDPSVSATGVVAFVVGIGRRARDLDDARRRLRAAAADRRRRPRCDAGDLARRLADRLRQRPGRRRRRPLDGSDADGSDAGPLLSAPGGRAGPAVLSHRRGRRRLEPPWAGTSTSRYVVDGGALGLTSTRSPSHALDETAAATPARRRPARLRARRRHPDRLLRRHRRVPARGLDPPRSDDPAFSPDGTQVAYTADGALIVAAAGGLNPAPLALPGLGPARPGLGRRPPIEAPARDHDHQGPAGPHRAAQREVSVPLQRARLDVPMQARPAGLRGLRFAADLQAAGAEAPPLPRARASTPPATLIRRRRGTAFGSSPGPSRAPRPPGPCRRRTAPG